MNNKYSELLFERAKTLLPGGVSSPVRSFNAVGGSPLFIASASGAYLTDVDNNQYIDYIGSWGPMILGHGNSDVIRAIGETARKGAGFGTPGTVELELAQEIIERVPSAEKIRFVNSGTEATMSAIRLARAATGRDYILKFEGCYHGHADSFLVSAGSGVATLGLPNSPGVTEGAVFNTLSAPYNDLGAVEDVFAEHHGKIAAVIIEPVAGNMGVVCPKEGFLEGLRNICDSNSSVLIFDEVMTGFRVAMGGAQDRYKIKPDLTTLGKIIGGGLPVGAYCGKSDLMDLIAPSGDVYQAGTLSGNPVAMAAGLATLRQLDEKFYEQLTHVSNLLYSGLCSVVEDIDAEVQINRVGSMLTMFFSSTPIENFKDAGNSDHNDYSKFFNNMLNNGVHLPPSGYESWFVSCAHTEVVIEDTLKAVRDSLASLK